MGMRQAQDRCTKRRSLLQTMGTPFAPSSTVVDPCACLERHIMLSLKRNAKAKLRKCNKWLPAWVKDMEAEALEGANPASVGTLALSEKRTLQERENDVKLSRHEEHNRGVFLTGQCAGAITDIQPAKEIIDDMVSLAAEHLRTSSSYLVARL